MQPFFESKPEYVVSVDLYLNATKKAEQIVKKQFLLLPIPGLSDTAY